MLFVSPKPTASKPLRIHRQEYQNLTKVLNTSVEELQASF